MTTVLVETLNGIGGWVGIMLGILYIYNRNSPLGAYDMLFILGSPVLSAASLNVLFFGTSRVLMFILQVYATMLHQEIQVMAAYLIFTTSLLSGMVYTINNLEKARLAEYAVTNEEDNGEVDENEGEAIDEDDVDVVYDNDAGEVADDGTTVEDEVVYEEDEGEVADEGEEDDEDEEADEGEEADEDEETDDAKSNEDDEDNFADDEADDNPVQKEDHNKIGLSILNMYRKVYGVMFVEQ